MGYAGGTTDGPTYQDLGDHSESVEIDFDPGVISYEDLLDVFWQDADPTAESWSRQYRAAIFTRGDRQARLARESRAREAERLGRPVKTPIEPLRRFWRAEDCHQKFRLRSTPAWMDRFTDLSDAQLADSTAAARVNGFLDGHLGRGALEAELRRLGEAKRIEPEE